MNEPSLPTILIMSEANRSALKVKFASGETDEEIAYNFWVPVSDIQKASGWNGSGLKTGIKKPTMKCEKCGSSKVRVIDADATHHAFDRFFFKNYCPKCSPEKFGDSKRMDNK